MSRQTAEDRTAPSSPFRVGEWRVDAGLNQISTSSGEARRLEPRVMELLVYLATNPGVTLSRDQIFDAVWQGASVVDGVLPRAVSELRSALGDDARDPSYVQTVPRRGYRLIASVDLESPADAAAGETAAAEDSRRRPGRRPVLHALLALTALSAVLAVLLLTRRAEQTDRPGAAEAEAGPIESIAVLPLEDLSPQTGRPYFAQGMTDSLTASLARSRVLRVVAPYSARSREGLAPQSAGAQLGVDAVLVGSVIHDGSEVALTLQMISVRGGTVVWAGRFRQPMESVLALQADIARQVVREIQGEVAGDENQGTAPRARVDTEAFELTLEGRYRLGQRWESGMRRSRELFQDALVADPDYAPAWAGLAEAYLQLANYQVLTSRQAYPAARKAAERAVELDAGLPEAHTALGLVSLHEEWDLDGAEAAYRRAIDLGPSYANAHQLYAELLSFRGRHNEALETIRTARELDPFSPLIQAVEGVILLGAGRYDEAAARLDEAFDLEPSLLWTRRQRAYALERLGRRDEAARERMMVPHAEGDAARALRARVDADGLRGFYRWSLDQLGSLEDTRYPATLIAEYHAGLGEHETALRWIDRAVQEKGEYLLHLHRSPAFDALRDHPEFREPLVAAGVDPSIPTSIPSSP